MSPKLILLALVVAVNSTLLAMNSTAASADDSKLPIEIGVDDNGRFKIFIAEHDAIVGNKKISMRSIFKMDKETGSVWRYRQGVDSKGKPYEEFFEVPNQ